MDVRLTEEQLLLRQSARDFLAERCPMSLVREAMDSEDGFDAELWKEMSELGWQGLVVDESHGGAGLDVLDLSLLLTEMGRALVPGPYLSTVVASFAVSLGDSEPLQALWLPRIAAGSVRATLAQLEASGDWSEDGIQLVARFEADELVLEGCKHFAADAACADLFVVPARAESGELCVVAIEARTPGVSVEPTAYNDPVRRVGSLRLDGVRVPTSSLIAEPGRGGPLLARIQDHAKVALCAELCGVADRALELAVEYARTREQFGKPIGSFQAIQHKCAEMFVRLENMRSATLYAAWTLANEADDAHSSACLAKAYCSEAATAVTGEALQIHGGLGFTWEQDPHLYYKRAKASELAFGGAAANRELAARILLDGEIDAR